jgi:phage shock protein PspC (stress-responsive transcriptional regulator)
MSEHITHTPQVKRLERTPSDRIIAGVCGGLGRYFDLNPAVFRLGLVVLTLLGGAGILVYLAAVLVIPEEGAAQSVAERVLSERRDRPWPLVGLGMVAVALAVLLSRADVWPAAGAGWVFVLIAGLVILWSSRGRRARRVAIALTSFLVLLLAALIAAAAVAFSWFDVSLGDGVGKREYRPASISELHRSYEVGVGNLRVDLSQIGHVTKETHVKASIGVGKLRIVVPRDAAISVNARAKVGDVYVLRNHDDGRNAELHVNDGGKLVIDAKVGAGRIDVVRAG